MDRPVVESHLQRLKQCPSFAADPEARRLLERLAKPHLDATEQTPQERQLGIELFERPEWWDPQYDSVVRAAVGRLRNQLRECYENELAGEPIRFELTKGRFQLVVKDVDPSTRSSLEPKPPVAATTTADEPTNRNSRRTFLRMGLGAGTVAAAAFAVGSMVRSRRNEPYRLTRLTFDEEQISGARFQPGTDSILFSSGSGNDPVSLYSMAANGTSHRRKLGLAGHLMDVSPQGDWLTLRGSVVYVESASGKSRALDATATHAQYVGQDRFVSVLRLGVPTFIRTGDGRLVELGDCDVAAMRVSPDGERMAWVEVQKMGIYLRSLSLLEESAPQTLAVDWTRLGGEFIWSDNHHILISGFAAGETEEQAGVYRVGLDGTRKRLFSSPKLLALHDRNRAGQILATEEVSSIGCAYFGGAVTEPREVQCSTDMEPSSFDPAGRFLLVQEMVAKNIRGPRIHLLKVGETSGTEIGNGIHSSISPDGSAAAWHSPDGLSITVINFESMASEVHAVTRRTCEGLQWMPNGRELFLMLRESKDKVVPVLFDLKKKDWRELPPYWVWLSKPSVTGWSVSPKRESLTLVEFATGRGRVVCLMNSDWAPVNWSADGKVLYIQETTNEVAILAIHVEDGRRERLFALRPPAQVKDLLQFRKVVLSPDGRHCAYSYLREHSNLCLLEGVTSE